MILADCLAGLVVAACALALIHMLRSPLWSRAVSGFRRRPGAMFAVAVLGLYSLVAIADSFVLPARAGQPPETILDKLFARPQERTYSAPLAERTSEATPQPLLGRHILGTDGLGNDVLYRTLKGVRTAFLIGGATTLLVLPLALIFGLLAGYFGRWVDDAVQYVYTVFDSIPNILLLIAIMFVLGQGLLQMCLALGLTSWIGLCRIVRGETLKLRERGYVTSARALGYGSGRIIVRHILPNLLPILIIYATLSFSRLVLAEVILSYLQVGVPEYVGSWGNMIDAARLELTREPVIWWNLASATVAIFLLVFSLNVISDELRDGIDPSLRGA